MQTTLTSKEINGAVLYKSWWFPLHLHRWSRWLLQHAPWSTYLGSLDVTGMRSEPVAEDKPPQHCCYCWHFCSSRHQLGGLGTVPTNDALTIARGSSIFRSPSEQPSGVHLGKELERCSSGVKKPAQLRSQTALGFLESILEKSWEAAWAILESKGEIPTGKPRKSWENIYKMHGKHARTFLESDVRNFLEATQGISRNQWGDF